MHIIYLDKKCDGVCPGGEKDCESCTKEENIVGCFCASDDFGQSYCDHCAADLEGWCRLDLVNNGIYQLIDKDGITPPVVNETSLSLSLGEVLKKAGLQ